MPSWVTTLIRGSAMLIKRLYEDWPEGEWPAGPPPPSPAPSPAPDCNCEEVKNLLIRLSGHVMGNTDKLEILLSICGCLLLVVVFLLIIRCLWWVLKKCQPGQEFFFRVTRRVDEVEVNSQATNGLSNTPPSKSQKDDKKSRTSPTAPVHPGGAGGWRVPGVPETRRSHLRYAPAQNETDVDDGSESEIPASDSSKQKKRTGRSRRN